MVGCGCVGTVLSFLRAGHRRLMMHLRWCTIWIADSGSCAFSYNFVLLFLTRLIVCSWYTFHCPTKVRTSKYMSRACWTRIKVPAQKTLYIPDNMNDNWTRCMDVIGMILTCAGACLVVKSIILWTRKLRLHYCKKVQASGDQGNIP